MKRYFLSFILLSFCSLISVYTHSASSSISPRTYELLNDIQNYISENKLAKAKQELNELKEDLNKGLGLALTYQLLAQVALAQEQTSQAIGYFEQALKQKAFNEQQTITLSSTIAQLYLTQNKPNKTIQTLKPVLKKAANNKEVYDKIKAETFILLGTAYQLKEEFRNAIVWLKQGIKRKSPPKENWLQMLMAAYYQIKDYANSAKVVEQLIRLKPNKESYWQQLTSLYQLQNKYRKALTTLELAHSSGVLKKQESYLLLVQLLMRFDIPERGGRILQDAIKKGVVEASEKQWKLLATAFQQGKQRTRAIDALKKASQTAKNGELLFRAGQLAYAQADYKQLIELLGKAVKRGVKNKQKGQAYLLMGMAWFELKNTNQARAYFLKAEKIAGTSVSAKGWLNYIESIQES